MKVIDSSALIAQILVENGHPDVRSEIEQGAYISIINILEVYHKLRKLEAKSNLEAESIVNMRFMDNLPGLEVLPFLPEYATKVSLLPIDQNLSLGDRACLCTAMHLNLPVMTADKIWAKLKLPIEVQLIR